MHAHTYTITHRFQSFLSSESRCEQFNIRFENTSLPPDISHTRKDSLTHPPTCLLTAVTKLYEFTNFFQMPIKINSAWLSPSRWTLASVCQGLWEISLPLSCHSSFLSAIKPLDQAPAALSHGLLVGLDCLFLSSLFHFQTVCCRVFFF